MPAFKHCDIFKKVIGRQLPVVAIKPHKVFVPFGIHTGFFIWGDMMKID